MIRAYVFDIYGTLINEDTIETTAEKLYRDGGGFLDRFGGTNRTSIRS